MGKSKRETSDLVRGGEKMVSIMGNLIRAVRAAGGTDEDIDRLDSDTDEAKKFFVDIGRIIVARPEAIEYFIPLADANVPEQYQATLATYRKQATEHPQPVPATAPVCCRMMNGFTLMHHAPKAGPCYKNYEYLQDWKFTDEATEDGLVFWIPRILTGSTSKTKDQQVQLLSEFRAKLELPVRRNSSIIICIFFSMTFRLSIENWRSILLGITPNDPTKPLA